MQLVRSLVTALALSALAAPVLADAPKAPPRAAKDEVSAAEAEKFLAFFNKFADAVIQNKDACPKMATAINGVIDTHQETIKLANEMKAANKKLPKAVEDKLTARLKDMFQAMVKCKDDAGVKAAMSRLDGPSKKAASKKK